MEKITIRFVTTSDLSSSTIRRGEDGFWASHVEALTPDGFLFGAHADNGVAKRDRYYDKGQWILEMFVDVPCEKEQQEDFYDFLDKQVGKPYDWPTIVAIARGLLSGMASVDEGDEEESPSWICSALIVAALIHAGIVKSAPASIRLTDPRDVLNMLGVLVLLGAPNKPPTLTPMPSRTPSLIESFDPFRG